MTLPAFANLEKERQDRIVAFSLAGNVAGVFQEIATIVREEHAQLTASIKRLHAASPSMPIQYAALQAELALLAEMETLLVESLNATITEEIKHV